MLYYYANVYIFLNTHIGFLFTFTSVSRVRASALRGRAPARGALAGNEPSVGRSAGLVGARVARLETQAFHSRCPLPPAAVLLHPYDQHVAVAFKDNFG